MRRSAPFLCCLALGTTSIAYADEAHPGPPRKPPPAAYDACKDEAQGDACEVTFHERTIEGRCQPDREDGTLFCLPDHPPPRPTH